MKHKIYLPKKVFISLLITIILDTCIQLLWKKFATGLVLTLSPILVVESCIKNPIFLLILFMFIVQLINWLFLLKHAELSFAFPATSLSYVTVALSSYYLLNESLPYTKIIGIVLILVGVFFLSLVPNQTSICEIKHE